MAGSKLYFSAFTLETGNELWCTDGTPDGTHMVADVTPGESGSDLKPFGAIGGRLVFGTKASDDGCYDLWRTDGTAAGTERFYGRVVLANAPGDERNTPAVMNGVVYFNGSSDDQPGDQLWRSDATASDTYRLKSLNDSDADPNQFTVLGDSLYFVSVEFPTWTLWKSDGTAAGTVPAIGGSFGGIDGLRSVGGAL